MKENTVRMSKPTISLLVLLSLLPLTSFARMAPEAMQERASQPISAASPAYGAANHNVGNLVMNISNYGRFANDGGALRSNSDVFTGEALIACEFPKRSRTQYCFQAAFWIGAIVGRDTLVSTGADGWLTADEFHPDEPPFGSLVRRSIIDPESPEFVDAVSEQDFVAVYTDTYLSGVSGLNNDEVDGRPHRPLNIEVTQRSFQWSYSYAEDFVLFDFGIRNIGNRRIEQLYMGLYVDADVHPAGDAGGNGAQDDLCGFQEEWTFQYGSGNCDTTQKVNIAYISDNDGDFDNLNSPTGGTIVPDVTATRIVRTPADSLEVSFNWWISNTNPTLDFGPQQRGKFRVYNHGGTGTPSGDRQKYFVLSNGEFDYDQIFTASIEPTDPVWVEPPQANALTWSKSLDTRYLLSFGSFNIEPGQTLPISLAYVAGQGFHTDEDNFSDNLDLNYNPEEFKRNLGLDDLALNARWADWIYDNPGVDTDGDSNFGVAFIRDGNCNAPADAPPGAEIDTTFIQGDGVPDFRGASPPPAPKKWLEPSVNQIVVRFNGANSENFKDPFNQVKPLDFEGYRVYLGRDNRKASFSLLASFDRENYSKLIYNDGEWVIDLLSPFTPEELTALYSGGTPNWDPSIYTRANPYFLPGSDSIFAFVPQDFNRSEPGVTTPIQKRYPQAPEPPTLNPDSIPEQDRDLYLTEDGYFKFYEYEFTIDNLLPTVPYFVNVTAFDFGSPSSGLPSLETPRELNAAEGYALNPQDVAASEGEGIFVFPNPYRADENYLERGFEGRFSRFAQPIPDRERRITFANLPVVCTIRIYSLDGDLVDEFEHDATGAPEGDATAMQEKWDMITRNTQAVVSGIYYWSVEEPNGETTTGKLVIIR